MDVSCWFYNADHNSNNWQITLMEKSFRGLFVKYFWIDACAEIIANILLKYKQGESASKTNTQHNTHIDCSANNKNFSQTSLYIHTYTI